MVQPPDSFFKNLHIETVAFRSHNFSQDILDIYPCYPITNMHYEQHVLKGWLQAYNHCT